ncbi:tartrate dehydratase [Salmonella enterica]|nr:tartrate dehydratase [Salmonella enterica]
MPSEGYEGVVKFVFENISTLAVNACPPVLVGVGIATSVELPPCCHVKRYYAQSALAILIRKRLSWSCVWKRASTVWGSATRVDRNSSVMGVHIESAARHPSTIGVAVSTGCWAHRRGTLLVHSDLSFENLSHTRSAL